MQPQLAGFRLWRQALPAFRNGGANGGVAERASIIRIIAAMPRSPRAMST